MFQFEMQRARCRTVLFHVSLSSHTYRKRQIHGPKMWDEVYGGVHVCSNSCTHAVTTVTQLLRYAFTIYIYCRETRSTAVDGRMPQMSKR